MANQTETSGSPTQALALQNIGGGYNEGTYGVFGLNPLATPKYAVNKGVRDNEFKDTLARLFISIGDLSDTDKSRYLASLPPDQPTQSLAKVLAGTNSKGATGFIDFFLTQANEQFQEIVQIDKVLSDDYVSFFYGQQPPMFNYSGVLLNSLQDDQRTGFANAYRHILRGTSLARRGALARLRYDSVIVSGTMIAHSQALVAENEMAVQFSFTFLVKEYTLIQNLPYSKKGMGQYVQLVGDSIVASLQPVGTVNNTAVKTVAVVPPVPADSSSAGAEECPVPIGADKNKMQATIIKADASRTSTVTGNVRGTVSTPAPSPPTPPSKS